MLGDVNDADRPTGVDRLLQSEVDVVIGVAFVAGLRSALKSHAPGDDTKEEVDILVVLPVADVGSVDNDDVVDVLDANTGDCRLCACCRRCCDSIR